MAGFFHPRVSLYGKLILLALVSSVGLIALTSQSLKYSTYIVEQGTPVEQPIPFSHKHHVGGLGIDCRYCHTSVEKSAFAGFPPTHTCMSCHSQLWTQSEMLEPVRQSYKTGFPLHWVRVNRLPDYVYFNHAIHVNKGVGCATCHGKVNEMPITWRTRTFYMADCLSCHRNPGPNLRPKSEIFNLNWSAPSDPNARTELQHRLVQEYNIKPARRLIDCYVCHR